MGEGDDACEIAELVVVAVEQHAVTWARRPRSDRTPGRSCARPPEGRRRRRARRIHLVNECNQLLADSCLVRTPARFARPERPPLACCLAMVRRRACRRRRHDVPQHCGLRVRDPILGHQRPWLARVLPSFVRLPRSQHRTRRPAHACRGRGAQRQTPRSRARQGSAQVCDATSGYAYAVTRFRSLGSSCDVATRSHGKSRVKEAPPCGSVAGQPRAGSLACYERPRGLIRPRLVRAAQARGVKPRPRRCAVCRPAATDRRGRPGWCRPRAVASTAG